MLLGDAATIFPLPPLQINNFDLTFDRRYRQRKVDRVTELEEALAAMTKERDDFKINLARSEAEVDVLRRLVGGRKED